MNQQKQPPKENEYVDYYKEASLKRHIKKIEEFRETVGKYLFQTDISKLQNTEAFNAVKNYDYTTERGLWVFGESGKGKTRALVALANRIFAEKICPKIKWIKDFRFSSEAIYAAKNCEDLALIEEYASADFLFWDNFGETRITPSVSSAIFGIIAERCDIGKPIFFSTQYTLEKVASKFVESETSDALQRRIREFTKRILF